MVLIDQFENRHKIHCVFRSNPINVPETASPPQGLGVGQVFVSLLPRTSRAESKAHYLSPSAQDLLIEASKDRQGVSMSLATHEGRSVQTNDISFAGRGNTRSEAQWRSAVQELSRYRFVEDRACKGEVYFITDEGYKEAAQLEQQ